MSSDRATRILKLHKTLTKHFQSSVPPANWTVLDLLVYAFLLENASSTAAARAFAQLKELYFDWNEVRVTRTDELAGRMRGIPDARDVVQRIRESLQSIFKEDFWSDIESLKKSKVKSAKKAMEGIDGTTPFVRAYLRQHVFGDNIIPMSRGATALLVAVRVITDVEADEDAVDGLENAIPVHKTFEFSSLLQEAGTKLLGSPRSRNLKAIIKEVNPSFKSSRARTMPAKTAPEQRNQVQSSRRHLSKPKTATTRRMEMRGRRIATAAEVGEQIWDRLFVQACISTIGFPQSVDDFFDMIWWRLDEFEDPGFALHMDVIIQQAERTANGEFDADATTIEAWTAPKWFTQGDIMFLYHSVRATKWSRMIAHRLRGMQSKIIRRRTGARAMSRKQRLHEWSDQIISRAIQQADAYGGSIFACGRCSGPIEREPVGDSYWKGAFYAPLNGLTVFARPLPLKSFEHLARITQTTITPLFRDGFSCIVESLSRENELPAYLSAARIGEESLREISAQNWRRINAECVVAFVTESQLREYFIDYLLNELKDAGTQVLKECACFRGGGHTGFADYFVMISGRWIPVEAKLNVLSELAIDDQLKQYLHLTAIKPTVAPNKGLTLPVASHAFCLVVDTHGIYLTSDGEWVGCTAGKPRIGRRDLPTLDVAVLRDEISKIE